MAGSSGGSPPPASAASPVPVPPEVDAAALDPATMLAIQQQFSFVIPPDAFKDHYEVTYIKLSSSSSARRRRRRCRRRRRRRRLDSPPESLPPPSS